MTTTDNLSQRSRVVTHFASPERVSAGDLEKDVQIATQNAVIDGLLTTIGGLLAVLNEHRQILAINDALLHTLGIEDAGQVLGLRLGEAIRCAHSGDMPSGCGTSQYCATCGAAIAIVATLSDGKPQERKCTVTVPQDGKTADLCLRVRACRITVQARHFVLLFLQDVTADERRAALERAFFHDIGNIVMSLEGATGSLAAAEPAGQGEHVKRIQTLARRLVHEAKIQRTLSQAQMGEYQLWRVETSVERVIAELRDLFAAHPAREGKTLSLPESPPDGRLDTDLSLVVRVLTNMVTNALEAKDEGGEVRVWVERADGAATFCVWNRRAIPEEIALRVFQRHFTTKTGSGRGIGTYAMKLLGEELLGGAVDFSSSEAEGTVFRLSLPIAGTPE